MSDLFLPKEPAWDSLHPSMPQFKEVPDTVAADIQKVIGMRGKILKMRSADSSPIGYYRFEPLENNAPLFLKVISHEDARHQIQAEKIADFLKKSGVPANASLPGYPRYWDTQWAVFVYPYVPMRFARVDIADITEIGRVLAHLHSALLRCPFEKEIRNATEERQNIFLKWHHKLSVGEGDFVPRADVLKNIMRETPISFFDVIKDAGQVIHGDMNYGNLIFSTVTSKPTILDFEDTPHSWMPPIVDIAMAIERFVLVKTDDDNKAFQLAVKVIEEYKRHGGVGNVIKRQEILQDTMHILSARALCLLTEITHVGRSVPQSEWDKFFYLYEHANCRANLLRQIEQEFL